MRADPAYSVVSGQISPSQGQQKKQKHPERERFLALGEQGRWEQEEEFHQEGDRHQAGAGAVPEPANRPGPSRASLWRAPVAQILSEGSTSTEIWTGNASPR
jgi:hypothetical protein